MGLMDKVKKILFDEEDVEVTVSDGELPERTPKDKEKKVHAHTREEKAGFIDYHHEEEIDENPIKEVKVPEYDKIETKKFNMPEDDFDDTSEEEKEISRFSGLDDIFKEDKDEVKEINRFTTTSKREEPKERVIKDYRKILGESEEKEEHKPFKNTPIISPVWGILDKNYKPEDIVEKKDELTKVNVGAVAPRTYGPVSYNDEPLPGVKMKKKESKKEEPKDDVVELSNTISEMVDEKIDEDENLETMKRIESVVEEEILPTHTVDEIDDEDDTVIQTDGYDEYDSINSSYSVDTNIEDAFESTSEYESINNRDNEDDDKVDLDALINKKDDDEDDSGLDDTIETDLFNLIDSMYKDKEDE